MAKPKPKPKPGRDRGQRKIRRVARRRSKAFPPTPGPASVAELKRRLKSKDREKIVDAALQKLLLSEELKPYQAELIRMQFHLERTGRKLIILFDGRDASGKGGTIRRVTR